MAYQHDLIQARRRFFASTRQPDQGTFWLHLADRQFPSAVFLSPEERSLAEDWQPTNSNCPLLSESLDALISSVPSIWKADAKSIFAGRTVEPDTNARSWRSSGSKLVEIELQFTHVISEFADAFDDFVAVLGEIRNGALKSSGSEFETRLNDLQTRVWESWKKLESSREGWDSLDYIVAGAFAFPRTSKNRSKQENFEHLCEEFILGHELAHHFLGHTANTSAQRKKRQLAQEALEHIYEKTQLHELVSGLNSRHTQEVQCDIILFELIAKSFDSRPSYINIYRATAASFVALTALGYVSGHWETSPGNETHPGIITRLQAIELAVEAAIEGRVDVGDYGDHPRGLLAQCRVFAGFAIHAWHAHQKSESINAPQLLAYMGWVLNEAKSLSEIFDRSNRS